MNFVNILLKVSKRWMIFTTFILIKGKQQVHGFLCVFERWKQLSSDRRRWEGARLTAHSASCRLNHMWLTHYSLSGTGEGLFQLFYKHTHAADVTEALLLWLLPKTSPQTLTMIIRFQVSHFICKKPFSHHCITNVNHFWCAIIWNNNFGSNRKCKCKRESFGY